MREGKKLAEAEYFLSRMKDTLEDRIPFMHNLSAFLTAARSVLQYAHAEARTKPGGQGWYDAQVRGSKNVGFLKDRRDLNIHVQPVDVKADIDIHVAEDHSIRVTESVTIEISEGGKIIGRHHSESVAAEPAGDTTARPATISTIYKFTDWNGPEDLLTLCQQYLDDLGRIVTDGRSRGFLT
jgi:hypothetical protein